MYNYHTHSHYDDGKEPLEAYVLAAIEKGLTTLGFSAHVPLPFKNAWSLPKEKLPEYLAEAKRLKEQYKQLLNIYVGMEMDYLPGHTDDFRKMKEEWGLDYCIGSVHLVMKPGSRDSKDIWFIDGPREGYLKGIREIFNGDARLAATAYYDQQTEMVSTQKPDIIGHMDKVNMHNQGELFDPDENWHQRAIDRLLDAIKDSGTIVEVNTRGIYTGKTSTYYPDIPIIKKCRDRNIPLMVNTDAHHPSQLDSHFQEATQLVEKLGGSIAPFLSAKDDCN